MTKSKEKSLPVKPSLPAVIETLDDHAAVIHTLGARVIADVIEIGRRLTLAKTFAGHSKWLSWLEVEFGWSDQSARNFMRVHELAKSKNFLDLNLPVSAIYQLAAPSTPPVAVETVAARAEAGEKMTGADVKKVVDDARTAKAGSSSSPPPVSPSQSGELVLGQTSERDFPPPSEAFKRAEKMRREKLKKDKADVKAPKQSMKAREAERHTLSDERFEKSAAILEAFVKEYFDMPVWKDTISTIQGALGGRGRHLEMPPPFGLKEAVAVLIAQYGPDAVSNEVLEHNT